jgi:hypothetical protein
VESIPERVTVPCFLPPSYHLLFTNLLWRGEWILKESRSDPSKRLGESVEPELDRSEVLVPPSQK